MKEPFVSIVLFSYNAKNLLSLLLPSLAVQTYTNFEVLLYDFRSTDGTKAWIEKEFPFIKIYYPPGAFEDYGFSKIYNLGIKAAQGDYILALNLDVILENNFLSELIQAVKNRSEVGWAAGKMLKLSPQGDKLDKVDCLGEYMYRGRNIMGLDLSKVFDWKDYDQPKYVFGASGCAALYKKKMLESIAIGQEYFDEDFYAYYEDGDLNWRAQLLGWKCLYVPTAVGYHIRGASGWLKNPKLTACILSNRFLMIIKNDEFAHVIKDFFPIMRRTLIDTLACLIKNPRGALWFPFRTIKYIPKMLPKRKFIKKKQAVASEAVWALFI